MENALIGHTNHVDGALLSGGSWLTALPLTRLQNRTLGRVARSSDLLPASTTIEIDLQTPRPIRVVGLAKHNGSPRGTWRVVSSALADFSILISDSGWVDIWPVVFPFGSLPWEHPSAWDGRYTEEQLAGYTPLMLHILSAPTLARYWRIEIDDESNTDNYFQAGRLFIGEGWQPEENLSMDHPLTIRWEDQSRSRRARSGAMYFENLSRARVANFNTAQLTEDEAYGVVFELQRLSGITGEVVYIQDPDDTLHAIRRQFLGRMRQLSAIEYPYPGHNVAWEIEELI